MLDIIYTVMIIAVILGFGWFVNKCGIEEGRARAEMELKPLRNPIAILEEGDDERWSAKVGYRYPGGRFDTVLITSIDERTSDAQYMARRVRLLMPTATIEFANAVIEEDK